MAGAYGEVMARQDRQTVGQASVKQDTRRALHTEMLGDVPER